MTSLVSSLGSFLRFHNISGRIQVQEPEQTVATGTIAPFVLQEYQSILPLAGKYADAPFMRNFSEFLEKYRQEINKLNEE